jgi:hypothetical protein
MTVRFVPTIKRFIEGASNVVFPASGDPHELRRAKDFMNQDLTGSDRLYSR